MSLIDVKTAASRLEVTVVSVYTYIKKGYLKVVTEETRGYTGRPSFMLDEDEVVEFARKRFEKLPAKRKASTFGKLGDDILTQVENLEAAIDLVQEMLDDLKAAVKKLKS